MFKAEHLTVPLDYLHAASASPSALLLATARPADRSITLVTVTLFTPFNEVLFCVNLSPYSGAVGRFAHIKCS